MTSFPGPDCLGRGIVLPAGRPVPEAFRGAPQVTITEAVLQAPAATAALLHEAWALRRRVVVFLAVPAERLKEPEVCALPPHALPAEFSLARERLQFLVWANNYDGDTWRLAAFAIARLRAGAGVDTDVVLSDGTPAWCDGGPRGPLPVPVVHGESLALGRLTLARDGPPTDDLAPDQRAAVLHPAGAARVIAPAGSGKTRVLTARLRYLLQGRGVEPEIVTAVAYNKRAAVELAERTRDVRPRVKTLHALGYEILRRRGDPRVLSEREVRGLLRALVHVEPQKGRDPWVSWIEALAEVRLALRPPGDVERSRGNIPGFAGVFEKYRKLLRSENAIDHDEQIYGAIEVLLTSPEERREAQRRCRHLLVDEFQDLTPAYLLLIRLLAAPSWQVYGVGDDDQVIYGYLGATPEYLIDFRKLFPGAAEYALERNYRCPPPVVEAAARLLKRNRRRVVKKIFAAAETSEDVPLRVDRVPSGEVAEHAVGLVRSFLEAGAKPTDIAVLCRVNEALLPVEVALDVAGIPCSAAVDASVLERVGARAAFAWLALACGPEPMPTRLLQEAMRRPSRVIRRVTIDGLGKRPAWTLADLNGFARGSPPWEADSIREWVAALRTIRGKAAASTADLLRWIREDVGLDRDLEELDESHSQAGAGTHLDELVALEQIAPLHPDPATFEAWLRERLHRGHGDGVTLSSVHRVKGLEWSWVIVYGASWGLMPHRLAEGPAALEEERRVFHVAITRGRRAVRVVADAAWPSAYVSEMVSEPSLKSAPLKGKKKPLGGALPPLSAVVGVKLDEPHEGTICAVADEHVTLELRSGARLKVAYGTRVISGGQRMRLARSIGG
ncbi:MAG: ATP-dependent helicase [Armatimonadetes bacterium]|nr:ATP-dependent helicase [Armatimonadota bacterium]